MWTWAVAYETSSMVIEVSAMLVASTTLVRSQGGAGLRARDMVSGRVRVRARARTKG